MASETEITKMAATQRAALLREGEGGRRWVLMVLPAVSIIWDSPVIANLMNTNGAKAEVAGLARLGDGAGLGVGVAVAQASALVSQFGVGVGKQS